MSLLHVAVSTCDRKHNYVNQTLRSLIAADAQIASHFPVRLVVCGTDAGYIEKYSDGIFRVETMTDDELAAIDGFVPARRCSANFVRVLRGAEPGKPILMIEDDVVFSRLWLTRGLSYIIDNAIECGPRFVCSFFSPCHNTTGRIDPRSYSFLCAAYISAPVVQPLADYVQAHGVDVDELPCDLLVGRFLADTGGNAFRLSLAQHVGEVSTGCSQKYVRSDTFVA